MRLPTRLSAALIFIGSGVILHVGIGLRWPFAVKAEKYAGNADLSSGGSKPPGVRSVNAGQVEVLRWVAAGLDAGIPLLEEFGIGEIVPSVTRERDQPD